FAAGDLREFTVSSRGELADLLSTPAVPAELRIVRAGHWDATDPATAWAALARDSFDGKRSFQPYEEVNYPSFDGRMIQGWVVKPPDFDPARRWPLVLYIHGGPHSAYGATFFHEFQVLSAAGYVVLITNPRGSTSYGEEFANVIQYRYPGDDYRDLMAGVDLLLARGYIDPTRLVVGGGSGGGLLTAWTISQTGRFAAALVERAVTNWHSFVGTADLNRYFATRWFRDFPWRDTADYLARSPLQQVDRVRTPVFVIHSTDDYRTALDQGLQYYTALRMQGKPARLAIFPQSAHGLSREGRPSQRVRRLELILEWFGEYAPGGGR
ncbi:MAG: alpha/beta hydrolase family protein, partial [Gammaproteobacteria bacterium]